MPLIYCDHNFVVTAHAESDAYKDHLRQLAATGTATYVLSPMHWVDAASDNDTVRGTSKADFMDSLRARWLFDRRTIQRKEVADAFFRFLGIAGERSQMMGDVADVIADLAGQRAHRDSSAFVTHLRGIGENHPLEQSLSRAFESNRENGIRFRRGALSPALMQRVERMYVSQLLPTATPSGVVIDAGSKQEFLTLCQLTDFPSVVLENRATHDNWREARQLSRNNFIDQQHLMAMPYTDFFVTDDARLTGLISRISAGLPFRLANLLTKAEFDARYP